MESLYNYAKEQYNLVRDSRKVLMDYCKTISLEDFLNENSAFGRGGSIRNLFVHTINTYEFWIAKWGLNKPIAFTPYIYAIGINEVIELFDSVDKFMYEFLELLNDSEMKQIKYEINGVTNSASSLRLFTHVITHEFHHKGQILSLSRHLGYIPVDTDIMR